MLTRYWIEFKFEKPSDLPYGLAYGCGVTAFSYEDAINIIRSKMFMGETFPEIKTKTDNVDIQSLDQGHVIPNMLPTNMRGIWFPMGFHDNY